MSEPIKQPSLPSDQDHKLIELKRQLSTHFRLYVSGLLLTLLVAGIAVLFLFRVSAVDGFQGFLSGTNDADTRVLSSAQIEVLQQARKQAQQTKDTLDQNLETLEMQRQIFSYAAEVIAGNNRPLPSVYGTLDELQRYETKRLIHGLLELSFSDILNRMGSRIVEIARNFDQRSAGGTFSVYRLPTLDSEARATLKAAISYPEYIELFDRDDWTISDALLPLQTSSGPARGILEIRLEVLKQNVQEGILLVSEQTKDQADYIAQIDAVVRDFGTPTRTAEIADALANFVVRVGTLGLVIFIVQIMLSFTRYHARMADHYRGLVSALILADYEIKKFENLAPAVTKDVDFGTVPLSAFERAIDSLALSKRKSAE